MKTSPRRISLGVSIGVFVAFTPSIGFPMGMALVIASILNASRLAAVACVWLTNLLTMGPVFAFTCLVDRPFWFSSHEVNRKVVSALTLQKNACVTAGPLPTYRHLRSCAHRTP